MINQFELYDTVRVIDKNGRLVKEGIIVEMTSSGAKVYDSKCEHPYTDNIQFCEWFPFHSRERSMVKSANQRKKVKVV